MTAAERETLHALFELIHQQEEHRRELREDDDAWRDKMDVKVDAMRAELRKLNDGLDAVPEQIDEAIAACRADREAKTAGVVKAYANGLAVRAWWRCWWKVAAAALAATGLALGLYEAAVRIFG